MKHLKLSGYEFLQRKIAAGQQGEVKNKEVESTPAMGKFEKPLGEISYGCMTLYSSI